MTTKNFIFTLGADPEMFICNVGDQSKMIPVVGLVGGTKGEPRRFADHQTAKSRGWDQYGPDFKYQEDGVAYEVNIPPSSSRTEFCTAIERVLCFSRSLLQDKGLCYSTELSSYRFSNSQLSTPEAMTIGCDPDWQAYGPGNKPVKRKAFDIKDLGNYRHCGGHLHFGYDKALLPEHALVRLIDALIYLPLLSKDKQTARRGIYGLAGLYRPKPYGLEYRSMSNFWLNDPGQVARASFNLLLDIHNDIEKMYEVYMALPLADIEEMISKGGGKGWIELVRKIRGDIQVDIASVAALDTALGNTRATPTRVQLRA